MDDLSQRIALWIDAARGQPGSIWLDSQPCREYEIPRLFAAVASAVETSHTVLQSQARCHRFERSYREAGISDAQAYPARTKDNCRVLGKVRGAMTRGFSPKQATCNVCEHVKFCDYIDDLETAGKAKHNLATAARDIFGDFTKATEGKAVVMLACHSAASVMVPTATIRASADELVDELDEIHAAVSRGYVIALFRNNIERANLLMRIRSMALTLRSAVLEGERFDLPLPPGRYAHGSWQASLNGVCEQHRHSPSGPLMRMVAAWAQGNLESISVYSDGSKICIAAKWIPPTIAAPVIILDPSLSVATATAIFGREVKGIDSVMRPADDCQRPRRTTVAMRQSARARIIRANWPSDDVSRVGVVMPSRKIPALLAEFAEEERSRIVLRGHHSNLRDLSDCSPVIVLGGVPVPRRAIAERLLQMGRVGTLSEDPRWGEDLPWTTLVGDRLVTVHRRGYGHPQWQEVYHEMMRGRTLQVLACLPLGAIVYSDCDLGLPLAPEAVLDAVDRQILEALRGASDKNASKYKLQGNEEKYLGAFLSDSRNPLSTKELSQKIGIHLKSVQRRLVSLVRTGHVTRVGQRGGWMLAIPEK